MELGEGSRPSLWKKGRTETCWMSVASGEKVQLESRLIAVIMSCVKQRSFCFILTSAGTLDRLKDKAMEG